MSQRVEQFIRTPYRSQEVSKYYLLPACPAAERNFDNVFQHGVMCKDGSIRQEQATLANLYTAEIRGGDQWLERIPSRLVNYPVLVKNPRIQDRDLDYGETNAILQIGGYEGYLFLAVMSGNGFAIVRPVRGENQQGYNYQLELRRHLLVFRSRLPTNFIPPQWDSSDYNV